MPNSVTNLSTTGAIQVIEPSGVTGDNIPFVILSHGKNKLGATNIEGVVVTACNTSSTAAIGDSENCDNDATFRDILGQVTTGGVDDYDDSMVYSFLNTTNNSGGTCPAGQVMTGFSSAGPVCVATSSFTTPVSFGTCPEKEVMVGFSTTGPVCRDLEAAGIFKEFSTTVSQIATECIDGAVPNYSDNIPIDMTYEGGTGTPAALSAVRFFNTCAGRFCNNRGYNEGMVKENMHGNALVRCIGFR